MRLNELIYLPHLLASHSSVIVRSLGQLNDADLHEYWVASRARLYVWGQRLRTLNSADESEMKDDQNAARWVTLLREVLLTEITTRVWCALLEGLDERFGVQDYGAIGQSVLAGHLDARHRVLNLMVRPQLRGVSKLRKLNEDRRQFEEVCDRLLLQLPTICPVQAHLTGPWVNCLVNDPPKVDVRGPVMAIGLLAVSPHLARESTANGALHRRVSNSILACLGSGFFSFGGLPAGPFLTGLMQPLDDRQGGITDWLPKSGKTGVLGRF